MAGIPQTLPVPPLVNEMTMLNAIRLAAEGGSPGGSTAWNDITGKPTTIDTLATGFGAVFPAPLVSWNGSNYELYTGTIPAYLGGTGVANGLSSTLTLPNSATTITGGGTLGLGGFTLTVPATGTAALLGTANAFSVSGAASTPAISLTGSWFTGGSTTTTKPQFLVEPTGATTTAWSTAGTGIGVNAASGFTGNLIDAKLNNVTAFKVDYLGIAAIGSAANAGSVGLMMTSSNGTINLGSTGAGDLLLSSGIVVKVNGTLRFGFTGGSDPILTAGASTLTLSQAKLVTVASSTSYAGLNMPNGVAPTSPVNGDMWQDGTDFKIRIGGVTKTVTLL